MKTLKIAFLIVFVCAVFASTAFCSGYPDLSLTINPATGSSTLVVINYDDATINITDAQQISENITRIFASASGPSLGLPGVSVVHLTPYDVAGYGVTDGDALADIVYTYYQSSGVQKYYYVIIYRVGAFTDITGNDLRMDVYLANGGLFISGMSGKYVYLRSLEIPEMFLSLSGL